MVVIDLYFFQALKVVTHSTSSRTKLIIYISYWFISITAIVLLLLLPYINFENKFFRNVVFACIAGLFFAKIISSAVFLIDDIRRGVQWLAGKVIYSNTEGEAYQKRGEYITLTFSQLGRNAGRCRFFWVARLRFQ